MSNLRPEPYYGWRCNRGAKSRGAWPEKTALERMAYHLRHHLDPAGNPCDAQLYVVLEASI